MPTVAPTYPLLLLLLIYCSPATSVSDQTDPTHCKLPSGRCLRMQPINRELASNDGSYNGNGDEHVRKIYTKATTLCTENGFNLAILDEQEEFDALCDKWLKPISDELYWIGLSRNANATWMWADGTGYNDIYQDLTHGSSNKLCMAMKYKGGEQACELHRKNCDNQEFGICIAEEMYRDWRKSIDAPVVHFTPNASVKGKVVYLEDRKRPVYTYLGIPFAEAPVGDLRLKKTVPKKMWKGQREATQFGPGSCQMMEGINPWLEGAGMPTISATSEDCLFLNVYTPSYNKKEDKLPVMVWIHGGAFSVMGAECFPGQAYPGLHDVVFVSINYRLGILGFFSTGDEMCKGNFGLWDQIEGLKWVQEHISKFGGDPNNVTIFGQSAGSMSVCYHHVMSPSQGLFHRSIHQSGVGTTMGVMTTANKNREFSKSIATTLGLADDASSADVYDALMKIPVEELGKFTVAPKPSVDGELFTQDSHTSYMKGDFFKTNTIYTYTSHEAAMGTTYLLGDNPMKTREDFRKAVNSFLADQTLVDIKNAEEFAKKAEEVYVEIEDRIEEAVVDFFSDSGFTAPVQAYIDKHADAVAEGVYLGVYGYRISHSQNKPFVGADHGEDCITGSGIPLLALADRKKQYNDVDREMSRTLINYFCNFAKNGNPNGESLEPVWPNYSTAKQNYLYLDKNSSVRNSYAAARMKFWESIPLLV